MSVRFHARDIRPCCTMWIGHETFEQVGAVMDRVRCRRPACRTYYNYGDSWASYRCVLHFQNDRRHNEVDGHARFEFECVGEQSA